MLRVAEHFAGSDVGRRRRINEDALFARPPIFVVADGMGGAQAGEVASRIAVDTFAAGLPEAEDSVGQLITATRDANTKIYESAQQNAKQAGMGTTLTALYVDSATVVIAHVGDSRAYVLRGGNLKRLTRDHSLVEEMVQSGQISEQEAGEHPHRSIITRALGPEPTIDVDTRTYRAVDGDVFLLCSDGLTSMIGEPQIEQILQQSDRLDVAGRELLRAANEAGGRDNITVLLARVEEVGGPTDHTQLPTSEITEDRPPAKAATTAKVKADGGMTTHLAPPVATPAPGAPKPKAPKQRGRSRRALRVLAVCVAILVPVLIGGWLAARSVYFVGTDNQGRLTVYRGVPFELPLGIDLFEQRFTSEVPAVALTPQQRELVLDHTLRSRDDAYDLITKIRQGKLE